MNGPQTTVVGIDVGHRQLHDLEHLADELVATAILPDASVVCTHIVRQPEPHYAATFAIDGPVDLTNLVAVTGGGVAWIGGPDGPLLAGDIEPRSQAAEAATAHLNRQAGRALRFPGQFDIAEQISVAELSERTAIDGITTVGGVPSETALIRTGGFLRPQYHAGRLILAVTPAVGTTLIPFEVANPHEYCAAH